MTLTRPIPVFEARVPHVQASYPQVHIHHLHPVPSSQIYELEQQGAYFFLPFRFIVIVVASFIRIPSGNQKLPFVVEETVRDLPTTSLKLRATSPSFPTDYVGLVLLTYKTTTFYLQIRLDHISTFCLKPLKYLLFLGWCILAVILVLGLKYRSEEIRNC